MMSGFAKSFQGLGQHRWVLWGILAVLVAGVAAVAILRSGAEPRGNLEMSSQSSRSGPRYIPSQAEWAALTVAPVSDYTFRTERVTEGKIAVDEDRATPVFSPYAGRVIRLLARPGVHVTKGQPLLFIEAEDTVQAQNEFIAAAAVL